MASDPGGGGVQTPGRVLWISSDGEVQIGHKLKPQTFYGLENPLDQNDGRTKNVGRGGGGLAQFTGLKKTTNHGSRISNFIFQSETPKNTILNFGAYKYPEGIK